MNGHSQTAETFRTFANPHAIAGREIQCLVCGSVSSHPGDLVNRYCGHCHEYHEDLVRAVERGSVSILPTVLPILAISQEQAPVLGWLDGTLQTTVLVRLFNRGRLVISRPPDYYVHPVTGEDDGWGSISDYWCYDSYWGAMSALLTWNPEKGAEPDGWVKHGGSGRRRINADPRYEFRTFEEETEARLLFARDQDAI